MNRFFDIPFIPSKELMPWESKRLGLPTTTGQFMLIGQLKFRSDIAGGIIVLNEGFISDLASIPDGAAALFGINTDDQRIAGGAWIHDYIYQEEGKGIIVWNDDFTEYKLVNLTRKQSDQILCCEAMPDLFAGKGRAEIAYQNLRRFGKKWKSESFWERFT